MKKFVLSIVTTLLVCVSAHSQTGEGYINYKSYKTHYGNGSSSTYNGVSYNGGELQKTTIIVE